MNDEHFTISQLNKYIKDVINAGFPQALWVCGEIQQFDRNKSKRHIFFELVEKDELSKDINAKIGLVLFAGTKPKIDSILKESENAFGLKDDIEVKFLCRVDFYAPHGAIRLIVESIDPYYTLGKLAQEKQKLITLLQKEGVFEKNKQLELPQVPLNIGLISSYDSAAYNDFCDELKKSGYGFKINFRNALMQGKEAERDIVGGINQLVKNEPLDLIVITRGGGSLADLSCFDSRMIAEKIAALSVPVLTGIGHEINMSITDMAAHTYAKTPTAIAQFLVDRVNNFILILDEKLERIIEGTKILIGDEKRRIRDNSHALHNGTIAFLQDHNEQIVRFREIIKSRPAIYLKRQSQELLGQQRNMVKLALDQIKSEGEKFRNYDRIIHAYHPKNTLKRGFSLTKLKDGNVLKSVEQLDIDETIVTEVYDGSFESTINKINKLNDNNRDQL